MAIIKHKDIFDDSKKVFDNLNKELDTLDKKVVKLTESNKKLAKSLQTVKKTSDGTEAKQLIKLTNQLESSTAKLAVTETDQSKKLVEVKVEQQRLNKVNREAATLANSNISLYQKESIKLNNLRKEYKELAIQNKQNTKEGKKLLANLSKLDKKLKAVDNAVGQNQRSVGKYTNALKGLGKQLIGSLGLIGGFTALISIMKDAFKIFVEFQKTNSKLASVLGKTSKEITILTKQQKQLGATTAFTASQVGELQIELAKLGFSLREIENSTPGILALAAATGTELAQAAELAGATLRIFNLDASEMSRVTDVLALASSKSTLSMEKLATILPTVGKTAQIAGVSLEKTAALAGTLTDRGLDASSAATSLRNIFLELSKQGLTWNDAMQQINESTDKNKTSMDLFGKRSAAAGVILSETSDDIDKLTEALINADGAAQQMADTMLDNVAGDITKASSAWEGFILSIEDGEGVISRAIRGLVQSFTDFLGQLTLFNEVDIANKFKILANAVLALFNRFVPLVSLFNTLTGSNFELRFEIENTSASIDENTEAIEKNTNALDEEEDAIIELTAAQKLAIKQRKKAAEAIKEERIELEKITAARKKDLEGINEIPSLGADRVTQRDEENSKILGLENDLNDGLAVLRNAAAEKQQEEEDERDEKRKENAETFFNFIGELGKEISNAFLADKLASLEAQANREKTIAQGNADADIQILRDQLDKGLISKEEFATQSAQINANLAAENERIEKKLRLSSAKASRNKALFDIAINTAVAIIKAFASLGPIAGAAAAIGIGIAGGAQAAIVLASPLEFSKGTELVPGTGNKDTVPAILAPGERVVPAEINQMLNGIPNSDLPGLLNKQDNNMFLAHLLMNMNDTNKQILQATLKGGYVYQRGGNTFLMGADGSIEKFND